MADNLVVVGDAVTLWETRAIVVTWGKLGKTRRRFTEALHRRAAATLIVVIMVAQAVRTCKIK